MLISGDGYTLTKKHQPIQMFAGLAWVYSNKYSAPGHRGKLRMKLHLFGTAMLSSYIGSTDLWYVSGPTSRFNLNMKQRAQPAYPFRDTWISPDDVLAHCEAFLFFLTDRLQLHIHPNWQLSSVSLHCSHCWSQKLNYFWSPVTDAVIIYVICMLWKHHLWKLMDRRCWRH